MISFFLLKVYTLVVDFSNFVENVLIDGTNVINEVVNIDEFLVVECDNFFHCVKVFSDFECCVDNSLTVFCWCNCCRYTKYSQFSTNSCQVVAVIVVEVAEYFVVDGFYFDKVDVTVFDISISFFEVVVRLVIGFFVNDVDIRLDFVFGFLPSEFFLVHHRCVDVCLQCSLQWLTV